MVLKEQEFLVKEKQISRREAWKSIHYMKCLQNNSLNFCFEN